MPKAKLDHAFALAARCEDGKKRTDYYDEAVTGFVLECRPGGKTFYLRYGRGRSQKQVKLAAFGDAPFAQIKKKAERLRAEVALGGDPAAAKEAAKAVPIYAELAAMHMADAEQTQRSFATTEMYMRKHIVPRWGKVLITDINPRAISLWLASKRDEGLAPATVVKIKAIFGRSFELGARWGVPGCEGKNPVRAVETKPVDNARERYLTADEAARLIGAAEESRNPLLSPIVRLLLATGMRVGVLLSARWENVDVDRRTLFLPTTKNGRSRFVPLARSALNTIVELPRKKDAVFLFPSAKCPGEHLTTVKHGWQTARNGANLPGLRIHDLRHSSASFMINNGVDIYSVGKVLGHRSVQSTQRYSHLRQDTLLAAVEAGAAKQAQSA